MAAPVRHEPEREHAEAVGMQRAALEVPGCLGRGEGQWLPGAFDSPTWQIFSTYFPVFPTEDIQDMKNKSLELVTNAGILRMTQKATIPGWGRAWFNEEAKTNIFSYAEMAKKH